MIRYLYQNHLRVLFLLLFLLPLLGHAQTYPGKVGVGVDMGWNRPFVDAARNLRSFTRPDGTAVPKDAKGWPLADAQTVLMDMRPAPEWTGSIDDPEQFRQDVSGTYKCSFTGQGDINRIEGPFTVGPKTYNATTNTTSFDLIVNPPGPHHGLVVITFTNTRRTPSSPLNSGFTNLKAIKPGYDANTTQLFTNEFLNALRSGRFSTIRTMGFTHTNNSNPFFPGVTEWAHRKKVDDATYEDDNIGNENGAPWEVIVDLANAADVDLWINVPVAATDDYVTQLATLIKNRLEPDRKLYVEYSNEVWNWGFLQSVWNNEKAKTLGLNHIKNYAKRTVEIALLFRTVFGATSLNDKVRVINSWQIGWNPPDGMYEEQMQYISDTFGPPRNFIYGLGVAPYHNCGNACETGTVTQILDAMVASTDASVVDRKKIVAVATKWQIPGGMVAYEGGSDTGGGSATNIANKITAERSPRMKDIMVRDLRDNWFPHGGGLFMYLEVTSNYSRYGSWGLTDDVANPDRNYKFAAVREIVGTGTTTVPAAPAGLTATGGNGTVNLSWSPASGATGYRVKRSTTSGTSYTLIASPGITSYSDNTVTNGTTYYYVVSAVNAVGEGPNSTQASATPSAASGVTVTREFWSNVTGTAVAAIPVTTTPTGSDQLSSLEGPLNWADNYGSRIRAYVKPTTTGSYTFYLSGDDDCELWLSTDANPANKVRIAHITGGWTGSREWTKYPSQTSTARSLTANTNYYIEVLHKEGTGGDNVAVGWTGPGIGAITAIGSANLAPYSVQPPPAPANLAATAGNGTVGLSWTAVAGATSYTIKRHTGGNFNNLATGVTTTTYQDNTVANGTTYFYAVTATNANGESNVSNTASATPSAGTSTVTVTRELWSNVTGTAVSAIPVTTPPTSTSQLSSLEGPLDAGDNYGARIRAYVKPTTTGSYTFYLSGDDDCELWLSTDANPANKVRIASVTGWTSSREWTKYPSQTSTARSLTANTNYYIEVLHKEATGGDNVAVGWTGPGISAITVIGNPNLAPFTPGTGGGGTLLASDNFGAAAGALHNVATGTGWGAAWQVQNNDISVPGYNVATATALTYSTLSTSGGYAVGGDSYQTSGRALNVSATGPFGTYLTGDNIGAAGRTLWVSLLLRKDAANDEEVSATLHAGTTVSFPNPALVSVGYFGAASNDGTTRFWSLRVGTTVTRTNVAITTGQTALLVLKLDFAATSTAALFVNPSSLGGTAPATASASGTSTTSIAFKSLAFYGGNGFSGGAVDELRFGDSYAAVTPTGAARIGAESLDAALEVFPNPSNTGSLHVKVYAREAGTAVVSLAGTGGNRTLTKEYALRRGQNLLKVSTGTLPSGLYILSVQQGPGRMVKKVVVQ